MGGAQVLAMLGLQAVVVVGLIALVVRLDPATLAARWRREQQVRRGAAALLREADRIRRVG